MEADHNIQLARTYIYLRDFKQARSFARYMLEKNLCDKTQSEQRKLKRLAFTNSLIIAYARPFGPNRNFEKKSVSRLKETESALDDKQIQLHQHIITLRDQAYAHSDAALSIIEDLDYSQYAPLTLAVLPLDRAEVQGVLDLIDKWISYLELEKVRLRNHVNQDKK